MERSCKLAYVMPMDLRLRFAHVGNVLHMCQAFTRKGVSTTLVVPGRARWVDVDRLFEDYGIVNCFPIKFAPIPVIRAGRVRRGTRLFGLWSAWYLLKERYDVCYTRLPLYAYISGRLGIGSAVEMHMPSTSRLDDWAFAQIVHQIRSGDGPRQKTIAISRRLAEILNAQFDLPLSDVLVCHDAVDLAAYEGPKLGAGDLRCRLGLTDERMLFTYCGSLWEGRGVDMIAELAQRFPQSYFLIVGGDETQVRTYKQQYDQVQNLCFYGFVPNRDVPGILKGSDVLLMPHGKQATIHGKGSISQYTSPMKMFEYLAAAKPIIASGLPSILEILRPGENALIAEPENVDSWSACVSSLLADAALCRRLGLAARETAEANTWDQRADKIMDFIVR